jgi:hypothetical protein
LSTHLISIAILVALAVSLLLALKVGALGSQQVAAASTSMTVTSAHSERVVVMPTVGGELAIATIHVRETFTRSDSKALVDLIDLGTTVPDVRVDAAYCHRNTSVDSGSA